MEDALHVGPRPVDRGMQIEAGHVDVVAVIGLQQRPALDIDLDEARRGDFLVQHAVRIDQILVVMPRDLCADMVVDQVGHAIERHQAIARREIDPRRPLLFPHSSPDILDGANFGLTHITHRDRGSPNAG